MDDFEERLKRAKSAFDMARLAKEIDINSFSGKLAMTCLKSSGVGQTNINYVPLTGEQIKQARKEMGITQKELASAVGLSQGMISQVEAGNFKASGRALYEFIGRFLLSRQKTDRIQ